MIKLDPQLSRMLLVVLPLFALTLLAVIGVGIAAWKPQTKIWRRLQRQDRSQKDSEAFLLEQIAALRERLIEVEERSSLLVQPPPTRSGMNLSKRTQAVRMMRRGNKPEQIAAALSIPQNEAILLLRVYNATQ